MDDDPYAPDGLHANDHGHEFLPLEYIPGVGWAGRNGGISVTSGHSSTEHEGCWPSRAVVYGLGVNEGTPMAQAEFREHVEQLGAALAEQNPGAQILGGVIFDGDGRELPR
jgi:hypothetical protein